MGNDYFPCTNCKEIICDAGDYYSCDQCGDSFCEQCSDDLCTFYKCQNCEHPESTCQCEKRDIETIYLCDDCITGDRPKKRDLIDFLVLKAGFKNQEEVEKAYYAAKNIVPKRIVVKKVNEKMEFVEVDRWGLEEDDLFE